jgi:hypothetical protein
MTIFGKSLLTNSYFKIYKIIFLENPLTLNLAFISSIFFVSLPRSTNLL